MRVTKLNNCRSTSKCKKERESAVMKFWQAHVSVLESSETVLLDGVFVCLIGLFECASRFELLVM